MTRREQENNMMEDKGADMAVSHGQDLDYEITHRILSNISSPIVFDIGVERGSFTDLALECGASRIFAFEALPRHFAQLEKKYHGREDVKLFALAVSNKSGVANLSVAVDVNGTELDFYHSLSALGDTSTVFRNSQTLTVKTASLSDLYLQGVIPGEIDFLKVDTEGHDLMVLNGLGNLRPRIIMTEYWDSLPETSGENIYTLSDLVGWGRKCGYEATLVVRRHGRIESVEIGSSWSQAGDWGNILFFRDKADFNRLEPDFQSFASRAFGETARYIAKLEEDCESKEAVIGHLKVALEEAKAGESISLLQRVISWVR